MFRCYWCIDLNMVPPISSSMLSLCVGVSQVSSCMAAESLSLMTKTRLQSLCWGPKKLFTRANGKPSCQERKMRRRGISVCCWKAWGPAMCLRSECNHRKALHTHFVCQCENTLFLFFSPGELHSLWAQLRRDEPHLLSNFEEFLARVTHQITEAHQEKKEMESALQR